jgi:hypothetical protein
VTFSVQWQEEVNMPESLQSLTIEDRVTKLEREVASLKLQIAQFASSNGTGHAQLGGSAVEVPAEAWEEFQKCCEEARREIDRAESEA